MWLQDNKNKSPCTHSSPKQVCTHSTRSCSRQVRQLNTDAPADVEYDAIIIGSGMGGLATAAVMSSKGAKVLVLEK